MNQTNERLERIVRIKDGDYTDVREALLTRCSFITAVYFEQVNSCQGEQRSFNFGKQVGRLEGMLILTGLWGKVKFVSPMKWQKAVGCQCGGDKKVHQKKAVELFPDKKDEIMKCLDLSDAPCIAYYGYTLEKEIASIN